MAVFLYRVGEIMSMIELENVYYRYSEEDPWVLKGVDLEIEAGEFLALVGHNGSGKSTLVKMLNGLLLPDRGTVQVKGKKTVDEEQIWNIRQQVGMVFQNPDNQLVANIVEEDVAFGPENLGLPPEEIRTRVAEALKTVGMADYRRSAPHNLSGGQKQRVAIAGILALRPDCLVLDEPTAMLDPVGRKNVISTVHQLNQELGMTIVHITHLMSEVIRADRIIVLEAGQIVLEGTPEEIFSQLDKLEKYNLDLPQVTELAVELRQADLDISPAIFAVDRLVDELCLLK